MLQKLLSGQARSRVFRQQPRQQLAQLLRGVEQRTARGHGSELRGADGRGVREPLVPVLQEAQATVVHGVEVHHVLSLVARPSLLEGALVCQDVEEHDAGRPDVQLGRGGEAFQRSGGPRHNSGVGQHSLRNLWSRVQGREAGQAQRCCRQCQSTLQVDELPSLPESHDVGRLHVAVAEPLAMQQREARGQRAREVPDLGQGHKVPGAAAAVQKRVQGLIRELQDRIVAAVGCRGGRQRQLP
mmetsp:Transcript_145942/g.467868  ORF Transcript_145942/g.467868 Transcript_145942/m.467868 type:complete len:242 (+) Transcript_145942:269-994(+)